jgi:hypothetical protein
VIGRSYAAFLALTAGWLVVGALLAPGDALGLTVARLAIWWALLVMLMATAYYTIQEAPAARVTRWILRDLAINVVLFLVVAFTLLDGIQGSIVLDLRASGWIALVVAILHPAVTDRAHLRRHREDPAGSPVPQYLPPACIWIDWTTAALVAVALALI